MKVKLNRRMLRAALVVLIFILCGAALLYFVSFVDARLTEKRSVPDSDSDVQTVTYQGKAYVPREDLETVLFFGVDKYESETQTDAYNNPQLADFLLLAVFDRRAQSYQLLQLNRDTMTTIQILGLTGENAGTTTAQLALSHSYGSGGKDSCRNTVKAVSDLLYGITIDHYVRTTMDAVGKINDLVGGVSVTLEDDFSAIDPAMCKGETMTLTGQQALTYVRSRGGLEDSTNLHRMERQRQYLSNLWTVVKDKNEQDSGFLPQTLLEMSDCLISDCSVEKLSQLMDQFSDYPQPEIQTTEGTAKQGDEVMEYEVDEDALRAQVISLFYQPYEVNSPS